MAVLREEVTIVVAPEGVVQAEGFHPVEVVVEEDVHHPAVEAEDKFEPYL